MISFKDYKTNIYEAFRTEDLPKSFEKISNIISKNINQKLYRVPGLEDFKRISGEVGQGIRFFFDNQSIRFNLDKMNNIISIDIWDKSSSKDPKVLINTKDLSIVRILPLIISQIKEPKTGKFDIDEVAKRVVIKEAQEVTIGNKTYKSKTEAIKDLIAQGITDKNEIADMTGASVGQVSYLINVTPGQSEQPNFILVDKIKEALDDTPTADPNIIFQDIEAFTKMIVDGNAKSLIISGMAGIGKTFTVTDYLNKQGLVERSASEEGEDFDWIHVKGFSTPAGMYRTLYENRDKIMVFDDCDNVFKDPNGVNLLKGALDSYDRRILSWISRNTFNPKGMDEDKIKELLDDGKLPNHFEFTGKVIFITNIEKEKIDSAIRSRAIATIDVFLKSKDVALRIKSIMKGIKPNIANEDKEEVLNYLSDNMGSNLNIRTFVNAIIYRSSGCPDWRGLVERYAK